LIILIA